MKILVTGGSGFIGSNFIKSLINDNYKIINLDLLTYAASPKTLSELTKKNNYTFIKGDIGDKKKLKLILNTFLLVKRALGLEFKKKKRAI